MKRKILITFVIALIMATLISVLHLSYLENKSMQINKQEKNIWANKGYHFQGNNLLVRKQNGLLTFPFVFGDSLYVYNIDNDDWKLVEMNKLPFLNFGTAMSMQGNKIYYNKDLKGPGIEIYSKDINKPKEFEVIDQAGQYAASSEIIYYLKNAEPTKKSKGIYVNNVYKKDLRTGQESLFIKGAISYLRADENYLYCYDDMEKSILEISIKTEKIKRYHSFNKPEWIGELNTENLLWADCENIVKYNKVSNNSILIKKAVNKINVQNAIYRDGYFYYYLQDMDFYKLNINNGKETKIMSLTEDKKLSKYIREGSVFETVSYCSDFIGIELLYSIPKEFVEIQHKRLLIFDDDGKKIKDFKLSVGLI